MVRNFFLLSAIALSFQVFAVTGGLTTTDARFDGVLWYVFKAKFGSMEVSNGSSCTGFVVGPHKILTAGHCVERWAELAAQFSSKIKPVLILEIEGRGELGTRKILTLQSFDIHPKYKTLIRSPLQDSDQSFDLAVLTVEEALGPTVYAIINDLSLVRTSPVIVSGYGCDRTNKKDKKSAVREMKVGVRAIGNILASEVELPKATGQGATSFCPGDSGGPSFVEVNGQLVVVGVNRSSRPIVNQMGQTKGPNGSVTFHYTRTDPDFSENFVTRVDADSDRGNDYWLRNHVP
jgi:hypothetical protein